MRPITTQTSQINLQSSLKPWIYIYKGNNNNNRYSIYLFAALANKRHVHSSLQRKISCINEMLNKHKNTTFSPDIDYLIQFELAQ